MIQFFIYYLIGITLAQIPKPCFSPPQWEGRVHTYNKHLDAELTGKITYDSVYQRTRVLQDVKVGTIETYYNIITFYQFKVSYFIDMKTGKCSRLSNDEPWRDYGIQTDAKSLGEAYLGSSAIPGGGLLVTRWTGNETRPINQTASYISTWSYEGCLPIFDITFEPYNSVDFRFYYDITVGIEDPNVFIVPKQCLTEAEHDKLKLRDNYELLNLITMYVFKIIRRKTKVKIFHFYKQ